jgi:hypothetical protein
LIHQNPTYKRISSNDVLCRIMNHKTYIKEVNHVKNLSKGITTTRKQEIAFKANKKSKNKQVVVESSLHEEIQEVYEKEEFSRGDKKFKSTTKRTCYNYDKHDHFIANCPFERRDDDDDKKRNKPYKRTSATREEISPTRRTPMVKFTLDKNGIPMMRALTPIATVWQPWLSREHLLQASLSFQSSIKESTLVLWQRRTSVR